MVAFIIWSSVALIIFGIGIYSLLAKKAVGFYSGIEPPKVTDTKNLYAYLTSIEDNEVEIYINDEKYGTAFYMFGTEMIDIGNHNVGDKIKLKIKLKKSKFTLKGIELYYEDTKILEEYCNYLKKREVKLEKINSSKIEGTVSVNEDNQYILFTIPYSQGWKVKIDESEIEPYEVMDALLAIKIENGEHKIEMNYTPVGLNTGIKISIASFMVMLVILIIDKKSHKKVENKQKM